MILRLLVLLSVLTVAFSAAAQDVLVLGEVHDNAAHHAVQTQRVKDLKPRAIVYEMLTKDQAALVTPDLLGDKARLENLLQWEASGWPDFSMYYPIFSAAPDARVYGAQVTRDASRAVLTDGLSEVFGDDATRYGLDRDLPEDQQAIREAMQKEAHCNALPANLLPGMVVIQRLRDAVLARAVVQAIEETGGPVAVITGNGHARRDWGVPAYLAQAAPDLEIWVVGQTEDNADIEGGFDEIISSAAVERPDPCAGFQ
ncbi:ChaN family lipoprotein [Roseovarius sp. 217]|uniref:ChaN family lipoprotein n=1 Tax=Roseovarius sp. (strain 217) TaxID=314264 RepID=UPI0000685D6E|nr:ChaN family lipoprotein [Roseovarius sp. 217]EAQ26339.1 hypothetical protein ROS217_14221 [Roseovarius sp. 217]